MAAASDHATVPGVVLRHRMVSSFGEGYVGDGIGIPVLMSGKAVTLETDEDTDARIPVLPTRAVRPSPEGNPCFSLYRVARLPLGFQKRQYCSKVRLRVLAAGHRKWNETAQTPHRSSVSSNIRSKTSPVEASRPIRRDCCRSHNKRIAFRSRFGLEVGDCAEGEPVYNSIR